MHVTDENGGKSGTKDKRCKMEARPKGHQLSLVSHDADSLTEAVGKVPRQKLEHKLEHLFGKLRGKHTSKLAVEGFEEKELKQSADDLLEEEFLEKEKNSIKSADSASRTTR